MRLEIIVNVTLYCPGTARPCECPILHPSKGCPLHKIRVRYKTLKGLPAKPRGYMTSIQALMRDWSGPNQPHITTSTWLPALAQPTAARPGRASMCARAPLQAGECVGNVRAGAGPSSAHAPDQNGP